MDDEDVRELLVERRQELAGELARLTAAPAGPTPAVSFGKRVGDGTVEAVERISTTAVARRLAGAANEVDRALGKLDEGSYGTCDGCGGPIPAERLQALPWTALCVSCSAARRGPRRNG